MRYKMYIVYHISSGKWVKIGRNWKLVNNWGEATIYRTIAGITNSLGKYTPLANPIHRHGYLEK